MTKSRGKIELLSVLDLPAYLIPGIADEYGSASLLQALRKAISHNAYGADYIENILYQEMTPQREHPPVKLNQEALNRIRLQEPSLADYDAFVVRRRKRS